MQSSSYQEKSPSGNLFPTSNDDWTKENIETLYEWISIASFNILCLEKAIHHHRKIVRTTTIQGLILSTLSGTISATQFVQSNNVLKNYFNGAFVLMSFTIAIATGYIKVYQIQEQLEEYIRLKQEWISLSTGIITEIQLPLMLRQSAIKIINQNKMKYLDLLKMDTDIPIDIKKQVSEHFSSHMKGRGYSIAEIIVETAYGEHEKQFYKDKERDANEVFTNERLHVSKQMMKNEIIEELKKYYEKNVFDTISKDTLEEKKESPIKLRFNRRTRALISAINGNIKKEDDEESEESEFASAETNPLNIV